MKTGSWFQGAPNVGSHAVFRGMREPTASRDGITLGRTGVRGVDLIRLEDITKTYHLGELDVPVLKGVSITIGAARWSP